MNTKYETEKKDNEISLLNKDKDIQEEKMRKQKIIRNSFIGGFIIVLLFATSFLIQRNEIKKGKKLSDELLLNILPEEVLEKTVVLTLFQTDAAGQTNKNASFKPKNVYTVVSIVSGEENTAYLSLD